LLLKCLKLCENDLIESYIAQQNKRKLQRAVALMADEYENNNELTALSSLDSEDFQ